MLAQAVVALPWARISPASKSEIKVYIQYLQPSSSVNLYLSLLFLTIKSMIAWSVTGSVGLNVSVMMDALVTTYSFESKMTVPASPSAPSPGIISTLTEFATLSRSWRNITQWLVGGRPLSSPWLFKFLYIGA